MKQINTIAAAVSTIWCKVCIWSHSRVSWKVINPGQTHQILIKSEAERDREQVSHTVTSPSWRVQVWEVKNNLQWFQLEYIMTLSEAGKQSQLACAICYSLHQDADMFSS